MAAYVSAYPGRLILPDGTEVEQGGAVDVSAKMAKNAGVAGWIGAGWLVAGGADAKAADMKSDARKALEEKAAALSVEFTDETTDDELAAAIADKEGAGQ